MERSVENQALKGVVFKHARTVCANLDSRIIQAGAIPHAIDINANNT